MVDLGYQNLLLMKKNVHTRQMRASLPMPEIGGTARNSLPVSLVTHKNIWFGLRTDAQLILKILDLDFG